MLYQIIIAAALVLFWLNILLNLRSLKIPHGTGGLGKTAPLVSVLIPARDESANIETCLKSLQKQDYSNFEIVVLDDNSTDETAAIVKRTANGDTRIRLIEGKPLPEGWAGKPFACHQLAQQARGSWLLFTDADTIHTPDMLTSVITLALDLKPSLLSGFPHQITHSWPQKVAIPVLYFVIMSWLPLWLLQRHGRRAPSLAVGQFLLFSAEEYWRIGGHAAVKSRILEDVSLGVEVYRRGGTLLAVDLSRVVSCNMYRSVASMWEGFIKWAYSVAILSGWALVGLLTAAFVFFLLPFYWFFSFLLGSHAPFELQLVIFQMIAIFAMRWSVDVRFEEPAISSILHPLGFTFLVGAALFASLRRVAGVGIMWKKRLYSSESGVE